MAVGEVVFRIEPDRLAEVGDGAFDVGLGVMARPRLVVGQGGFRIEPDRFGVVGDGAIVVALIGVSERRADRSSRRLGWSRIASLKSAMARS